ncbi:hypothetical protein FE839_14940 [Klebsiella indica]|uniref:Uncharacterized protein n=1 Tax=Klebsiella indica TaxID=2582917 RepID=A0A5R9LFE5_9ENTR|nr:hypothetical protein [Klebsiella indica]TLV15160.1 hypothetical protein FE839_14940 [Klebsiella indica]
MNDTAMIAIYISMGSLIISLLGLANTIIQGKINRRNERLKVYDKIFHEVCEILLYDYNRNSQKKYTSHDKLMEQAVNQYANLHWVEQMYGPAHYEGTNFDTDEERMKFHHSVVEEFRKHQKTILSDFSLIKQSPVFHLDEELFRERFYRIMQYIKDNLSFFSPQVRKFWEETTLVSPDKIKCEYVSLLRVNEISCEPVEEEINDPYLNVLLMVRKEFREMNDAPMDKIKNKIFRMQSTFHKMLRKR